MLGNGGIFCWYSYVSPLMVHTSGFRSEDLTLIVMLAGFGMFAGNIVGGRDHTTVINGINRVEAKRKEDPAFNNTIETIIKKLDTNA